MIQVVTVLSHMTKKTDKYTSGTLKKETEKVMFVFIFS